MNAPNTTITNGIKCSICRADIKERHKIYQTRLKLGVICRICRKRFSDEDIEMIINLFFAFGEFFGARDRSKFSIEDTILEFAKNIDKGKVNFHSQNIRMWHKVLTHGITPKEFLKELSAFSELEL